MHEDGETIAEKIRRTKRGNENQNGVQKSFWMNNGKYKRKGDKFWMWWDQYCTDCVQELGHDWKWTSSPQHNFQQKKVMQKARAGSFDIRTTWGENLRRPLTKFRTHSKSIYGSWCALLYCSYIISSFGTMGEIRSSHQKRSFHTANATFVDSNHTLYETTIYWPHYCPTFILQYFPIFLDNSIYLTCLLYDRTVTASSWHPLAKTARNVHKLNT